MSYTYGGVAHISAHACCTAGDLVVNSSAHVVAEDVPHMTLQYLTDRVSGVCATLLDAKGLLL